jgi:N-acetylneuraminate synthase
MYMTHHASITINGKTVGPDEPVYIVAEMSANHGHDIERAKRIIEAAKKSGADAVKLQTYTPDTLTLDSDAERFRVGGTIWNGRRLYDLYREAHTPWKWQPELKKTAENLGLDCFSTPFDTTAVDFLEAHGFPCYKIASFEIVDIPLIRYAARTGKPMIVSTGMASIDEITEAVTAARDEGCTEIALLRCTSAYPAPPESMSLRTIPHMSETFRVPVGLSDHTLGIAVPVAAVALGSCIVEKHFTLSRSDGGPDSAFSLEPHEFKAMVDSVRVTEKASGDVRYGASDHEQESLAFRRSLFAVEDIPAGSTFTEQNVRSVRPGHGLHPRHLPDLPGKKAARDIKRGTPLTWDMIT